MLLGPAGMGQGCMQRPPSLITACQGQKAAVHAVLAEVRWVSGCCVMCRHQGSPHVDVAYSGAVQEAMRTREHGGAPRLRQHSVRAATCRYFLHHRKLKGRLLMLLRHRRAGSCTCLSERSA